jgi:apolipoprotein N-acyltransferase
MSDSASTSMSPRAQLPWWMLSVLSGLLVGISQPILIESLGGRAVLDGSGLTGLIAFVGLVPAFVAMEGQGPKRAYAVGFVTWLVAFCCIIHWIFTTVSVYGGLPVAFGLVTLLALTSAMAAYVASSFAVTRVLVRFYRVPQWVVLPLAVGGVELLRNVGPLGGFSWGSLGHSFATVPIYLQGAALVGVTGLTMLAVAVNAGIAAAVSAWLRREAMPKAPLAMALGLVVAFGAYGANRLGDDVLSGPKLRIALLQPNVNEGLADLTREPPAELLERFHAAQRDAVTQGAQVIIWPEGSFPRRGIQRDTKNLKRWNVMPDDVKPPAVSVIGISMQGRGTDSDGKATVQRHNSAVVVDANLDVHGVSHKTHLVPFGEYVPWPFGGIVRQFIPLGSLTPGARFEPTAVDVDGRTIKVGTTICYEGVFPEIQRELVRNGADFIANMTDDRWYGVSGMATQHLLMYALRAVETGRPVARATNTGISAWIDIHGGIHNPTGMYTRALLVDDMPLAHVDTLYLRLGDWAAFIGIVVVLLAWMWALVGGRAVLRKHPVSTTIVALVSAVGAGVGLAKWLQSDGIDEAASTQATLLVVLGLVVGVGALSRRSWGARAVRIVGVLAGVLGLVAVVVSRGSPLALAVVVGGVGLVFVSRAVSRHVDR